MNFLPTSLRSLTVTDSDSHIESHPMETVTLRVKVLPSIDHIYLYMSSGDIGAQLPRQAFSVVKVGCYQHTANARQV